MVKKKNYTLEDLKNAYDTKQVIDAYVQSVDNRCNLHCIFGDGIDGIIPREEVSAIVGDDGLVDAELCQKKKDKVMQVCIKALQIENDKVTQAILSRKDLELKVRKWLYMYLKPGMKLKGVVRGFTNRAAFVDVGGGVTGMLKVEDISKIRISKPEDKLRYGQRLECIVKAFDRDTGKIDLSIKELSKSFQELVKNIHEGDIIDGIVRGRTRLGIFIELKDNLVGMADIVAGIEYGQKVLVHVRRIIPEKEKIKLDIIG